MDLIRKIRRRLKTTPVDVKSTILNVRALNRQRNSVVLNRQIETDRVLADPELPLPFSQNATADVNLFEKYKERMNNRDLLLLAREPNVKRLYDIPFNINNMPNGVNFDILETLSNERLFFVFFVILIGCDRAHDFNKGSIRSIFKSKATEFLANPKTFKTTANSLAWLNDGFTRNKNIDDLFRVSQIGLINHIMEACDVDNNDTDVIIAHCIFLISCEINRECSTIFYTPTANISLKKYCKEALEIFYKSDSAAKKVSEAITRILGISAYPTVDVLGQACDNSVIIANTMYPPGLFAPDRIVQVRIDATGLGLNSAYDLAQLKENMENYKDLSNKNRQALILDSVSAYDTAQAGNLEKTFKTVNQVVERYIPQKIEAYVEIDGTRLYILDAQVTPDPAWKTGDPPPKITLDVYDFLNKKINRQFSSEDGSNSLSKVIGKIVKVWVIDYKKIVNIPMNVLNAKIVGEEIQILSSQKTLGDLMQLILYADAPGPKVFHTFDEICSAIGGVIGKTSVRDEGTALTKTFRRIYYPISLGQTLKLTYLSTCRINMNSSFGKNKDISKRIKIMTDSEIKNKLKLVGIKITKNVRGKRKYLTRKELESKALLFNKLQNTAKKMKIKLMYKSKNGMYKYKTYKRLQKEINSKYNKNSKSNRKYKKPLVRNFNFG